MAVGDVTVNQDEYASKNNATSVVFEAFWIHATDGVYAKKKKKNASLMLVGVTCPMCTSTLNITREKYSQDIGKIVSRSEV